MGLRQGSGPGIVRAPGGVEAMALQQPQETWWQAGRGIVHVGVPQWLQSLPGGVRTVGGNSSETAQVVASPEAWMATKLAAAVAAVCSICRLPCWCASAKIRGTRLSTHMRASSFGV